NKERGELERMDTRIEALEAEQSRLVARQCDPGFYKLAPSEIVDVKARSAAVAREIEQLLERWVELENLEQAGGATNQASPLYS
ncbi:MAG: hypothetical protein ABR497_10170, partial [Kiritimatiellia bacterium]